MRFYNKSSVAAMRADAIERVYKKDLCHMDSTARRRATRLGIGIQIPRQEGVANQALLGRQYSIPAAVACFLGIALVRLRSSTC